MIGGKERNAADKADALWPTVSAGRHPPRVQSKEKNHSNGAPTRWPGGRRRVTTWPESSECGRLVNYQIIARAGRAWVLFPEKPRSAQLLRLRVGRLFRYYRSKQTFAKDQKNREAQRVNSWACLGFLRLMKTPLKVLLFTLAILCIVIVAVIYATKPDMNVESAGVQANQLIASVGGPAKICDEANQIFKHFGVSKVKFFEPSELKDYPAIASLGNVDGIWPGEPPNIKIRVGTHVRGFIIQIVDTNNPVKYVKSSNTVEVIDSCIFVHR
jgi:hypothetical protein